MDDSTNKDTARRIPFRIATAIAALALVLGLTVVAMAQTGGGSTPAASPVPSTSDAPEAAFEDLLEDLRGPCDELEHANDHRCTGQATNDDDRDDDRSGPSGNSGPGSVDDDNEEDADDDHGGEDDDDRDRDDHGGDDKSGPGSDD